MRSSKGKNGFAIILGIVWGIMAVVWFFSIKNIFTYEKEHYYSDPSLVLGSIMQEDYGGAYSRMEDMLQYGLDVNVKPQYTEVAAEHDYLEGAVLYRMYSAEGLDDLAAVNKAKMEEAERNLGGLSFIKEEIDAAIGLTE